MKIPDSVRIIPNEKQRAIFETLSNKPLNKNNASLEVVILEKHKPTKLTAKGLINNITYSYPLHNIIDTTVIKAKETFSSIDLDELLQLNSATKGKYHSTEEILQLTAPPQGGFTPVVYMQPTNYLIQGDNSIDSSTDMSSIFNRETNRPRESLSYPL